MISCRDFSGTSFRICAYGFINLGTIYGQSGNKCPQFTCTLVDFSLHTDRWVVPKTDESIGERPVSRRVSLVVATSFCPNLSVLIQHLTGPISVITGQHTFQRYPDITWTPSVSRAIKHKKPIESPCEARLFRFCFSELQRGPKEFNIELSACSMFDVRLFQKLRDPP